LRKIVQAQDVFRALPNDLNLLCKVNLSPITFSRTILKWKSIEQSVIDYQHMPPRPYLFSFELYILNVTPNRLRSNLFAEKALSILKIGSFGDK